MSKDNIADFDATPVNNSDIGGINIAENCPAANINNAIRQLMTVIKDGDWGGANINANAATATSAATATDLASGSVLAIAKGGTGAADAAGARSNLGALDATHASAPSAHAALFAAKLGLDGLLHVRDEKASGTAGGSSVAATWNVRDLNTVKTNNISGASVGSNRITLPSGTYYIDASAPSYAVNTNRLKLYNTTDATDVFLGMNTRAEALSGSSIAVLRGVFTLSAAKALEIRHYTQSASVGSGLGNPSSAGTEAYTEVCIWKIE